MSNPTQGSSQSRLDIHIEDPATLQIKYAEKFVEYLKTRDKSTNKNEKLNCPVCSDNEWIFPNPAAFVNSYLLDKKSIDISQGYTLIMLMCSNCSYVMFFHSSKFEAFLLLEDKTNE